MNSGDAEEYVAAMGLTLAELQDIQARAPGTAVALALALTRVRALRRRPI